MIPHLWRWPTLFALMDGFHRAASRWLKVQHLKVLRAIAACRTALAAMSSSVILADSKHRLQLVFEPHCPSARGRTAEVVSQAFCRTAAGALLSSLFSPYLTSFAPIALQNKAIVYSICSNRRRNLLQIAADPHHLGAEIGF